MQEIRDFFFFHSLKCLECLECLKSIFHVVEKLKGYHGNGDAHSYIIHEYWGGVYYKPSNSISLTFEPDYLIQKYDLQYVTTEGTIAGNRYLFGNLDQKTMSFTLRLNYTINPELSVEYYGQPFISAGKYSNYKEITDVNADRYRDRFRIFMPEELNFNSGTNSYDFNENGAGNEVFSVSNPDYNFRQFRSNLVVRWEYLPGSTIYFSGHRDVQAQIQTVCFPMETI